MNYFLDTSALVKIYHHEAGSAFMRQIYESAVSLHIADLAQVEFTSATMQKLKSNALDEHAASAVFNKFEYDIETRYSVIPFMSAVTSEAMSILKNRDRIVLLRPLDALQLAYFRCCDAIEFTMVTADKRLQDAALKFGHTIRNPLSSSQ